MSKILVTGGSGFIGSRLVRRLRTDGHDVRILDLVAIPEFQAYTQVGDVADPGVVEAALAEVDYVFHLAAEHRDDVQPASKYYRTNVEGMHTLCLGMAKAGIRKIVFTSSVAVYGFEMNNVTEQQPPAPQNDYGKSKLDAEAVLLGWQRDDKRRIVSIIRPCVVFGPGNRGNVYNLLKQLVSGQFIMIGNGNNRKSMAYVDNVVDALVFLAHLDQSVVVNYADKPDLSMNELVQTITRMQRSQAANLRLPKWLGLTAGRVFDVLSRILGKPFVISAVRIKKFCANSVVNASRIYQLGFKANSELPAALRYTVVHEFGDKIQG